MFPDTILRMDTHIAMCWASKRACEENSVWATLTRKQCFRYAIRDLTENAENYLADFLAH